MNPSFERYVLVHNVFVGMNDISKYLTDALSLSDAVATHIDIREKQWLMENPQPNQVKLIQGWFMKKLTELYPDYQFLIDGNEVSIEEVLKMNIFTWNIKLHITYDEKLSKAFEKETL